MRPRSLYDIPTVQRSFLSLHIPDEIFAVFFILVLVCLAKDERIITLLHTSRSFQLAVGVLCIYCAINCTPWSFCFMLAFSGLVIWMLATHKPIYQTLSDLLRNLSPGGLRSAMKDRLEKGRRVAFDLPADEQTETGDEDEDGHDEMCSKVSSALGLEDASDDDMSMAGRSDTTDDMRQTTDDVDELKEFLQSKK